MSKTVDGFQAALAKTAWFLQHVKRGTFFYQVHLRGFQVDDVLNRGRADNKWHRIARRAPKKLLRRTAVSGEEHTATRAALDGRRGAYRVPASSLVACVDSDRKG